jgi:hypothetical protein
MASIINAVTKELVILTPHYVFGRNPAIANTHLPQGDISQSHSSVFWARDGWYLRDHSRNGTLIDGELIRQSTRKLMKKHIIRFGSDESTQWQILDLEPPTPYLKSVKRKDEVIKLSAVTELSHQDHHEAAIYYLPEKGWVFEREGITSNLSHGSKIVFQDDEWEFVSNGDIEETLDLGNITSNAYFLFNLSNDEEHIRLQLVMSPDEIIDLGSRSHNYLLLALSRAKLSDQLLDLPTEEQGWRQVDALVKDLSKEMGKDLDMYFLNLQIFRVRKQLSETLSFGAAFTNVIERRAGEIRLGHPFFCIKKGQQDLGSILP